MNKRLWLVLLIALAVVLCSSTLALAERADLIRIALKSEERTLNPHTYATEDGYNLLKLIYDPLMVVDENLKPMLWLAEEYQVSNDGLVHTFKIHEGVTFHDGKPLTAEDVKFTYEYAINDANAKTRFSTPSKVIKQINVLDPHTVEMVLSEQSPEFLTKPIAEMGILPKHIWENITDPYDPSANIGSGAYKLTEIKDGEYYRLEANPSYGLGTAVTKQLYLPIIKDPTAMFTALKSGAVDATMQYLSPELISDFKSNSKMKTIEGGGFISTMLYFNFERYPFNVTEFRTALAHATNRQEIIDIVMLGAAKPGSLGYIHPELSTYNPDVNVVDFDMNKARAMLDDLNFIDTNGDGIRESDRGEELSFEILVYATNPQRMRIAEFLRDWYREIGVSLTIKAMDMEVVDDLVWPEFDASKGREFDMVMWGWGASTMNSAQRLNEMMNSDLNKGNSNIGAYSNPELDTILNQLMIEPDSTKRIELIKQVQKLHSDNFSALTFYYGDLVFAYNPDIYDNWTFMLGSGIVNNLSLIDRSVIAATGQTQDAADDGHEEDINGNDAANPLDHPTENSGPQIFWIIGAIVALVIILIIVGKARAKKKK